MIRRPPISTLPDTLLPHTTPFRSKFTPAGGRVSIGFASAADGGLDIAVSDNGIGMSPEQIKSAFKAFERGSDPFVRASEGVGLGLALCSEIMRAHGGD